MLNCFPFKDEAQYILNRKKKGKEYLYYRILFLTLALIFYYFNVLTINKLAG